MKTETTTHSKGPWHVGSGEWRRHPDKGGSIMAIYDENCICLGLAYSSEQGPPPTREEQKANARLMASAPELVEALQECLGYVEDEWTGSGGKDLTGGAIQRAHNALAKAGVE